MNSRIVEFGGQRVIQMIIRDITERKRAEEELLRRKRELEALYVVSAAVSRSLDTSVILAGALKEAVEVLGMDAGEVWLVDENGRLTFTASHGISSAFLEESKRMRFTAGVGFPGIVLKSKEPLVVRDINKDERFLRKTPRVEGYKSFVAVPLMSKGRVSGTLDLFKRDIVVLSEEDIALLSSLGNTIGVALENARLFGEIRKSEERYRSLFESTLDGVYRTDANGVFTMINKAGALILGHKSPEEAIGRPAVDYWINPKDREAFVAEVKRRKSVRDYHVRGKRRSGEEFDIEVTARLLEEKGNFLGIEGIIRDITEKRKLEKELHGRLEELETFHRVAVGRELKMVELKEQIERLEARIRELESSRAALPYR